MKYRRGDVVLLNFPFSTGDGAKVRPALVVQSDRYNKLLANIIVAMITKSTKHAHHDRSQVVIELESQAGRQSGLLHISSIKCANLFTVHEDAVHRVIGRIPERTIFRVDAALQAAFDIQE